MKNKLRENEKRIGKNRKKKWKKLFLIFRGISQNPYIEFFWDRYRGPPPPRMISTVPVFRCLYCQNLGYWLWCRRCVAVGLMLMMSQRYITDCWHCDWWVGRARTCIPPQPAAICRPRLYNAACCRYLPLITSVSASLLFARTRVSLFILGLILLDRILSSLLRMAV